ncbi:MAG: DNA pilot protein [Microvirus sp.]|nr:MAG: DNA pilot protein [Microvirus sp.]
MPFPFAPIASVIGDAINYFTSSSNSDLAAQVSRENTDKTIAANKATAELAYQRDLAQWERSNAYNSPQEQMKRLKASGLNPMLAYGSGSVAGNSTSGGPVMGQPQAKYEYQAKQQPLIDTSRTAGAMQQYQLTQAQIDNVKANTTATQQKTANEVIQGALLAIESEFKSRKEAAGTTMAETQARFLEREKLLDILLKQAQTVGTQTQTEISRSMFPYDLAFKKGSLTQQGKQTEEIMSRIKNMGYQGLQTQKQTELTAKQIDLADLSKLLQNQDLLEKKYNNFLREMGTSMDDNPMKLGTRTFAQFIKWLVTEDKKPKEGYWEDQPIKK